MSVITRLSAIFLALFLWQGNAYADLEGIKKAAEAGNAEKQLELGILYEYGFKFKGNNQVPALTWYMLSADQGVAKAAKLRDALQAKLTAAQVQEAREEAEKLKATMAFKPAPVVEPGSETKSEPKPTPAVSPADEKPAVTEPKATPTPAVQTAPQTETTPAKAPAPASPPATEAATPAAPAATSAPSTPAATAPKPQAPAPSAPQTASPASAPAADQPK